jgi:hypothetical protein
MSAVVLTVIVAWLVLSALTTVAWTLLARGGLREDLRRGRLDDDLARVHADADDERESALPRPRGSRS